MLPEDYEEKTVSWEWKQNNLKINKRIVHYTCGKDIAVNSRSKNKERFYQKNVYSFEMESIFCQNAQCL